MNLRKHTHTSEYPSWLHVYTAESKHILTDVNTFQLVFGVNIEVGAVGQLSFMDVDNKIYLYWMIPCYYTQILNITNVVKDNCQIEGVDQNIILNTVHNFIMELYSDEQKHIAFISDKNPIETMHYLIRRYGYESKTFKKSGV